MFDDSYDSTCAGCDKHIIISGKPKYCCSPNDTMRECGCGGQDLNREFCENCKFENDFDPEKIDVTLTYNGEPVNEYQAEYILNFASDEIQEIIYKKAK